MNIERKYVIYSETLGFIKTLSGENNSIDVKYTTKQEEAKIYNTIGQAMEHASYMKSITEFTHKGEKHVFKVYPIFV